MIYREANKFLRDQEKLAASAKHKSKQTLMKENQCDAETPMVIKNYLRKSFADIMANEMEERIILALCGPRSKQNVAIAERLLKLLVDVTGEQCTLQTPKTGTQRILVFAADQMAVWMIDAVDAADKAVIDKKEKSLQGVEDGGKGDSKDEEEDDKSEPDVEIIHKKKRPSNVSSGPAEGSGDAAVERKVKSGKKPATSKTGGTEGKEASDTKAQSQSGTKKKQSSAERVGGKSGQNKTSRDQPQQKEGSRKDDGEKKPKTTSQAQSGTKGSTEGKSGAQTKRATSEKPTARPEDASKSSVKQPATRSQSRANVTPRRPSQTASKQDVSKTSAPTKTFSRQLSSSETRPVTDSRRGSKSSEQRPRTSSELQREKVGDMISSHISSMIKEGSARQTPRAEALRDVISKKLENSNMPLDQQAIDSIKDASILLAAYIDKQAENVELEYGSAPPPKALAQRGKGPVFSVKQTASSFVVKEVTHTDAAAKIAKARGHPAPGTITMSKGGFNPEESKEWAKWANDVVNMAGKWSKWIDSTVSKAVASAEKKKAGQDIPEWRDWKESAGQEALEWRRNKKLLNQSAALFKDKADNTGKPQSAPLPRHSQVPKELSKRK